MLHAQRFDYVVGADLLHWMVLLYIFLFFLFFSLFPFFPSLLTGRSGRRCGALDAMLLLFRLPTLGIRVSLHASASALLTYDVCGLILLVCICSYTTGMRG